MKFMIALLLLGAMTAGPSDEVRLWKDSSGKFSIRAKLVENRNGVVLLEKENGEKINVPLNRLSDEDRKFLRDQTKSRYKPKQSKSKQSPADSTSGETLDASPVSTSWPSWRGADRTGVSRETGLLQSWPENGPAELWRADGLGAGMSSIVVADDKIFTLGRSSGQQNIVCLSTSGQVLWKSPFAGSAEPNCTPTFDDGLVYGVGRNGVLACVRAETGEKVWSVDYSADFGGRMMSQWGFSESPLVDGELLICTPGGSGAMIVALNKKTGKVVWKTPMRDGGSRGKDGAGYSSIVISNAGGIKQYVTLVGRGVISVEARTGRPLWQYEKVANGTANVPTPIVSGNYVFCSSGYNDGGSALLEIQKRGSALGVREVYYYRSNEVQNHHGGMVLIDGHVYMGNGHNKGFPLCLEMRTGKVKWGGRLRGEGDGSAAIVAADGQIYFRYEDGKMALVEANPGAYKVNGSFRLPIRNGKSWPHPVVADGQLYIRCQDQIVCFDIKKK
ncbi:MAG: PQQ-binding-like beta-propeller repeat protein [Planctomycetota bacterium]|nr:PQQ-binding-like beta-propeller repeat protein [Planctomycetota bacterium]